MLVEGLTANFILNISAFCTERRIGLAIPSFYYYLKTECNLI